jgi:cortactin
LFTGTEGAKSLKSRFENLAKSNEDEAKKRAEEEKQRRQAREQREKEEQKKQQEVSSHSPVCHWQLSLLCS